MDFLLEGIKNITWQQAVMYVVGIILIILAIKKNLEPSLLLPMGFGAIIVNLPLSGVIALFKITSPFELIVPLPAMPLLNEIVLPFSVFKSIVDLFK